MGMPPRRVCWLKLALALDQSHSKSALWAVMNQFPVDVDSEAIFLDNAWYTRDDLAQRIKAMIDEGDFAIARPSAALEELTATLQSVRTLTLRLMPEVAEALDSLAAQSDKSIGELLREAVNQMLAAPLSLPLPVSTPPHQPHEAQLEAPLVPEAPPPEPRVTAPTAVSPAIAGPGALRAAGIARDSEPTVEVNTSSEGRWFKQ